MADLQLFVSTKGKDAPGNGASNKPFRTIQNAAAELSRRLTSGQTGQILVEPGLYEEVVVLTSNMQLLRKDSKEQVTLDVAAESMSEQFPAVRLKRPADASAPTRDSSKPTWPEVLKIHGKNVLVRGIRVEGDRRPQRAVFIHDSEGVTIQGCAISGAHSKILYVGRGTGTKGDPFHSKVSEEGEGAGMRILRSKKVVVRNCLFAENRTELKYEQAVKDADIETLKSNWKYKAAVLTHTIDPVKVEQKLRQPQPVRDGGGHVSCFDADEILIENCFFLDGFCGGRGGAVQLAHNAYASFNKCLFRGNESGVDGGAFAFSDPDPKFFTRKPVTFTACSFKNNKSGDDAGGAYFTTNAQATLTNCLFEGNQASANGGGVRATFGARIRLVNCTFRFNRANIDHATRLEKNQDGGGAIAVQDASLEMQGGKVENNKCCGFAGGGLYFITAAYDENAEMVAEITHGTKFETILKQGYKVTSAELKLSNVIFSFNQAVDETCYADTCTLSPRAGFKAGGAGGAIYVLESLKDFKFPLTALLDKVVVVENQSTHNEDKQKADLVFRNVTKLVMSGTSIIKHPSTKYRLSLISVHDADLSASPQILLARKSGEVFEENSVVKP